MAGKLSTSVTATFDVTGEGSTGPRWVFEPSNRPPVVPEGAVIGNCGVYFRAHPSVTALTLETTTGSVSVSNAGLSRVVSEVVTFNGTKIAQLRYDDARDVKWKVLGNMIPAGTELGSNVITITYDSAKRSLVASGLCYGTVQADYTAPYDLMLGKFDIRAPTLPRRTGLPFATTSPTPEDDEPNTVLPMVVVGRRTIPISVDGVNPVVASITLTPPEVTGTDLEDGFGDKGEWALNFLTGSTITSLRMDVDPERPAHLYSSSPSITKPEARVFVRVVPAAHPDLSFTSGAFVQWHDGYGNAVKQILPWNGQASQTLLCQAEGPVSVSALGSFVDRKGRAFTPVFGLPGQEISVATHGPNGEVTSRTKKTVGRGEVIVVDTWGDAIDCYGVAVLDFSYTYSVFEFKFDFDENLGTFIEAFAVAQLDTQTAFIRLDPPSMKGSQ